MKIHRFRGIVKFFRRFWPAVSDAYSRGEIGLGEARNTLKDFLRAEGYDDPRQAGMRNLASTGRLNLILKQK